MQLDEKTDVTAKGRFILGNMLTEYNSEAEFLAELHEDEDFGELGVEINTVHHPFSYYIHTPQRRMEFAHFLKLEAEEKVGPDASLRVHGL